MPSFNSISAAKLSLLVGTPNCPILLDVRADDELAGDARLIPGAIRRDAGSVVNWASSFKDRRALVICRTGRTVSQGVAAFLRLSQIPAQTLDGGFEAWANDRLPLISAGKIPPRDAAGRTTWVTRFRPKIDRIACPWLIRRFVDPAAQFLFVSPADLDAVAQRFNATPFDIEGAFWSHRGTSCTFDTMLEEFALKTPPLLRLATIVRGADSARLDLAPEAPGLLAASLGLSRMFSSDLEQLEAGMVLYDAFYRWCRDASGETHDFQSHTARRANKEGSALVQATVGRSPLPLDQSEVSNADDP